MIPLTIFGLAEYVARMREAQRNYDDIQSDQHRNAKISLELQVDALLIVTMREAAHGELRDLAQSVLSMRKMQHELNVRSSVRDALCIRLEGECDRTLNAYADEVKRLNRLISMQNAEILPSIIKREK